MTETIGCPLCRTTASKTVIEENGYTGRQCDICGLIYISPRPSRDEMEELYARGNAHLSPEFFIGNARSVTARLNARHDVSLMTRHVTNGSLLEIGPGSGSFLASARAHGFSVYGVELNPRQAQFIRDVRGIPCSTSLPGARDLGPSEFDVIYHCDVLSHFYDPLGEMRAINALIRPGGLQIFETGNLGDVDHGEFRRIRTFQYPDHLFFYSERSILALLRETGFEHVKTYRYSRLPEQLIRTQIWRVTRRSRGQARADGDGAPEVDKPSPDMDHDMPSKGGRLARDALDLGLFGLRVTVGRLVVRRDVLQSLIVVARKIA